MNLVRDDEGTFVTTYGKPTIERPREQVGWTPPVGIPSDVLPELAKANAAIDRALLRESEVGVGARFVAFVVLVGVLLVVTVAATFIPAIPTGGSIASDHSPAESYSWDQTDAFYTALWLRQYVYNLSLGLPALVIWFTYVTFGFLYRGVCTGASLPFFSMLGSRATLLGVWALEFVLFVAAGVFVVAARELPSSVSTPWVQTLLRLWHVDQAVLAFDVMYNVSFVMFPFILGLHTPAVLMVPPLRMLAFKVNRFEWARISVVEWIVLVVPALTVMALVLTQAVLLLLERLLGLYVVLLFLGCLAILVISVASWRWTILLPRLWVVCVSVIVACRFFNPLSSLLLAFFSGWMVERLQRYGFLLLWEPRKRNFYMRLYRAWLRNAADIDDVDVIDVLPLARSRQPAFTRMEAISSPLPVLETADDVDDALMGPIDLE